MTKGDVVTLVCWVLSIASFACGIAVAIALRPADYWEPAYRAMIALAILGVALFVLPFLIDGIRRRL